MPYKDKGTQEKKEFNDIHHLKFKVNYPDLSKRVMDPIRINRNQSNPNELSQKCADGSTDGS